MAEWRSESWKAYLFFLAPVSFIFSGELSGAGWLARAHLCLRVAKYRHRFETLTFGFVSL